MANPKPTRMTEQFRTGLIKKTGTINTLTVRFKRPEEKALLLQVKKKSMELGISINSIMLDAIREYAFRKYAIISAPIELTKESLDDI